VCNGLKAIYWLEKRAQLGEPVNGFFIGENMKEIWKDIPGYEGLYQVNNLGRIKSLSRRLKAKPKRIIQERILKERIDRHGYIKVNIYKNGKIKVIKIHQIVALLFLNNFDKKREINHKDGNKQNNRIENLEWCTHKENMQHASKNGLMSRGEKHFSVKLTKKDVIKIKKFCDKTNQSDLEIALKFNISRKTINDIRHKRTWKWLREV